MPPKHPLSDSKKAILKQWIEEGARWGNNDLDLFSITTDVRAGRDWWSLRPLRDVPAPAADSQWGRNAIDAFVLQRLRAEGLGPSPEADPRDLIRRLYFDLIGLPPTPEQVAAFVADPSDANYQNIVDDLLNSRHYGERWARHWLDVVRYGESDGFERNFQRENAWHYRDWIIKALNDDMPYDEFARMQLIGDQLNGGTEGAAATGFWVAGLHNTVVGGSERMKQLARQDEIEDVVGTLGQTFVGLTLNCARCHDHKFDPITQTEYYQFASTISGLGFGERDVPIPSEQAKLVELDRRLTDLKKQLDNIDKAARDKVLAARAQDEAVASVPPQALARWEFDHDLNDSIGNLHGTPRGNARIENGALVVDGESYVETLPLQKDIVEKTLEVWVQLDNLDQRGGAAISIGMQANGFFDAIVFGELEPKRWMAGSNNFVRTESFHATEETDAVTQSVHLAFVYQQEGTITAYRNGLAYGQSVRKAAVQPYEANETEILFGLRHKPPGGNRHLACRIHRAALYDRALTPEEVAASTGSSHDYVSEDQLLAFIDEPQREVRASLKSQIADLAKTRVDQAANSTQKTYTLIPGAGQTTNVFLRGDPANVGELVSPAATQAIGELSSDFGLPPDAPEADRRRKLAQWITSDQNPLFPRVIANRVWHHHFGSGIVDTPNDFGFNGGRPSHPDLLDFLAWQFRSQGYRLKWLHRLMVTSSTYRQATLLPNRAQSNEAANKDASNRLLWRGNLRRIEAESLRDAILSVSGQLKDEAGGPGFKDVSITLNNGTTYFEPIAVDGPEFFRRSVYRFNPRGERSALLDTFDCPDPASTTPRRSVTTTPLQSLSLLNNDLVLLMSDYFAQRVVSEVGDNPANQVTRAWSLAIAREPNESERKLSEDLVNKQGLSALCRGLFNVNEFVVLQ
jgi:Protein of unknown function (DUF1549)/Protein of unknown function (DUF1553)/Concanavalin A-like lectin/glucanases superfamily